MSNSMQQFIEETKTQIDELDALYETALDAIRLAINVKATKKEIADLRAEAEIAWVRLNTLNVWFRKFEAVNA